MYLRAKAGDRICYVEDGFLAFFGLTFSPEKVFLGKLDLPYFWPGKNELEKREKKGKNLKKT